MLIAILDISLVIHREQKIKYFLSCDFLAFFIEEESRNYKGDHKMGRPSLCSATLYLRRYVHTLQFIFGGVPLHLPVPLHVYIITHFGHFEV